MLQSYSIATSPDLTHECSSAHLSVGMKVAITKHGLKDHNNHNLCNKLLVSAGIGAIALPVLVGGGIGLAFGGEAIGLGIAELGVVGAGTGSVVAKMTTDTVTGHRTNLSNVTLIDMVGVVMNIRERWWDQPGDDVEISWKALDEHGDVVKFRAWHNPEHLYGLQAV